MQHKLWLSMLLVIIIPTLLIAQVGKVHGVVVDGKSKEPLVGANVILEGTKMGAATDVDGEFFIINVPVGSYNLKVSYIGYRPVTITGIRVNQNLTTDINVELLSEDVQLQAVEIVAQRPLVNKDYTNTLQVKTAEDIQTLPVRGVTNVVGLQASVVQNEGSNTLYIRGGRAEETNVMIDGVSVVNPLNGQASPIFANLNQNSVEELQVQTGGFNAEYGAAMSGVINVVTKAATNKYTVTGEVITDAFLKPEVGKNKGWGYNVYNITAGGPIIPDENIGTVFIGIERQYLGDNDPRAVGGYKPNTTTQSWNLNTKVSLSLIPSVDIRVGGMAYLRHGNTWDNIRRFLDSEHHEKFDNATYSAFAKVTHSLESNLFYTAQFGYFQELIERGDPIFWNDLEAYGDTTKNRYLAAQGVNPPRKYSTIASPGEVFNRYIKSNSRILSFNGDINYQLGNHFLKAGVEAKHYLIRYYRINPLELAATAPGSGADAQWKRYRDNGVQYYGYTFDGKSENDVNNYFGRRLEYPRHPVYYATYVQDKVELTDLVLNIGVRVDYFNANERVVKDPYNPFGARGTINGGVFDPSDLGYSEGYLTVSPRLGFSFPVTDRAVFHAQYGRFVQMPALQDVLISKTYQEYIMAEAPYSTQIPNPNLKPERTTSYEVGYRQLITDNTALSFTGFYKEIKDLIQARNVGTKAQPAYPNGYETFQNVDFGTVKGVDIIFEMRRTHNVALSVNYTLSYANGTGSDPTTQSRISWQQTEHPKIIAPLEYDRRHAGSVNIDYRTGLNEGPSIEGIYPFENFGVNMLFTFNSGVPYTRSIITNPFFGGVTEIQPQGTINAATGPWNYRIDLRIDRGFKIADIQFVASLYIINLTNAKNVYDVYTGTGEPDNSGWLSTPEGKDWAAQYGPEAVAIFKARENDPFNFGLPRMVRLGLRVEY